MQDKLLECSLVAGKLRNNLFLFKNRDNKNYGEIKIIHEIINGIEIAYLSDPTGWVEGMNEYGIGFVFAYLSTKDYSNELYHSSWATQLSKEKVDKKYEEKTENFKKIILSKTVLEAVDVIIESKWNGNYFVGNKDEIWEIECFEKEVKKRKVEFTENGEFKVKTNHGIMIPMAGHLSQTQDISRASSEIRKVQAERYLVGFKNYTDIIQRMGQQVFSDRSSLNTFRTDDYEKTTSQVLLDLKRVIINFVYYEENSKFYGIVNNLPKSYQPKIQIAVRDKQEFSQDEFLRFKEKEKDLYFHWQGLQHSKGETKSTY